jgi:hypothetical protein
MLVNTAVIKMAPRSADLRHFRTFYPFFSGIAYTYNYKSGDKSLFFTLTASEEHI